MATSRYKNIRRSNEFARVVIAQLDSVDTNDDGVATIGDLTAALTSDALTLLQVSSVEELLEKLERDGATTINMTEVRQYALDIDAKNQEASNEDGDEQKDDGGAESPTLQGKAQLDSALIPDLASLKALGPARASEGGPGDGGAGAAAVETLRAEFSKEFHTLKMDMSSVSERMGSLEKRLTRLDANVEKLLVALENRNALSGTFSSGNLLALSEGGESVVDESIRPMTGSFSLASRPMTSGSMVGGMRTPRMNVDAIPSLDQGASPLVASRFASMKRSAARAKSFLSGKESVGDT